ncbi:MAG: T9SS type A sorting domain-containing protein [Ignavibacteria bacterium]
MDELDWSLPGLKNDTADFQGGILVWHIDENVIDAKIESNTINNDIEHKGVDVEEAKGSQDIGVVVHTPIGDIISDGFFVDFWYDGNHYRPSNIYRNEFTPTSFPNSKSYSNTNSRVCITAFSQIGPNMTFNYQQCGNITNINTFPRLVGIDTTGNAQPIGFDYNGNGLDEMFVNVKDSLYGFRDNGNSIRVDKPNGFLKDSAAGFIVGYYPNTVNGQTKFVTGVYGNKISLINFTIDSLTAVPSVIQFNSNSNFSSPQLQFLGSPDQLSSGTVSGKIFKLDLASQGITYDSVSNRKIIQLAKEIVSVNQVIRFIDDANKFLAETDVVLAQQVDIQTEPVIVSGSNSVSLDGTIISQNLSLTNVYSSPVAADINKDGNIEIVFTADNKVFAINQNGVLLDNFPFSVPNVSRISSGCSVADLNGDGIFEVIFGTGDGRVYAYGTDGKILEGFPLTTGGVINSTPAVINTGGNFGLLVYSQDGYLYGYKTPWAYDSTRVIWRNYLRDKDHTNSNLDRFSPSASGPCLPKEKVYNWPNPAYGKSTNIRYYLNGDASGIDIKIMDLSGELVTTLKGTTNKGFDNEVPWDITNVQSGIYIAVFEMTGGCSETASIKIAVVK